MAIEIYNKSSHAVMNSDYKDVFSSGTIVVSLFEGALLINFNGINYFNLVKRVISKEDFEKACTAFMHHVFSYRMVICNIHKLEDYLLSKESQEFNKEASDFVYEFNSDLMFSDLDEIQKLGADAPMIDTEAEKIPKAINLHVKFLQELKKKTLQERSHISTYNTIPLKFSKNTADISQAGGEFHIDETLMETIDQKVKTFFKENLDKHMDQLDYKAIELANYLDNFKELPENMTKESINKCLVAHCEKLL